VGRLCSCFLYFSIVFLYCICGQSGTKLDLISGFLLLDTDVCQIHLIRSTVTSFCTFRHPSVQHPSASSGISASCSKLPGAFCVVGSDLLSFRRNSTITHIIRTLTATPPHSTITFSSSLHARRLLLVPRPWTISVRFGGDLLCMSYVVQL
jgi:hypothetical protein